MKWVVDDMFAGGAVWDLKKTGCLGTETVGYVQHSLRPGEGRIYAVIWNTLGEKVPPGFHRAEASNSWRKGGYTSLQEAALDLAKFFNLPIAQRS